MTDHDDPVDLDFLLHEDIGDVDFEIPAASSAPVVDFRTLEGADARAAWDLLREWVEWFAVRYNISASIVPACWFKHGALVDELSALHIAHTVAFDPSDTGYGPIGWHEQLSVAMPRLRRAYYGQCSRGHDSFKPRSWTNAVNEQEWDGWVKGAHA
ncbi:hypothetical protein AAIB33_09865 [Microbacterium sp. AZCO]|uniref:hypothetical protein n=1 Tax=Microbacterium sp. AZCO TaxID=3142976 RepID=UPI0031F3DE8F